MLRDGLLVIAESVEQPLASAVGIGHCFERREGLGGHDEQRLRRVEVTGCLDKVNAVNIGDEAECHRPLAVVFERFVGHDWPEVGAADADVDDVADALAGVACPGAAADAAREIGHLVQHGVDLGHHVLAVHDNGRVFGARRATWSTARFSVRLILSPWNMASMRSRRPDSSASCTSSLRVLSATRFLEKSRKRPAAAAVMRSARLGWSLKSARKYHLRAVR